MSDLSFNKIARAWKTMVANPDKALAMKVQSPSLIHPDAIRIKNVDTDDDTNIHIRFYGFDASSSDAKGIPTIKRMVMNWIKKISDHVQIIDSASSDLNMIISTQMRFTEAAVPVFRRDPKTNKMKRAYKCIGGRKNGRRVSNPDQCLQYPNIEKGIKLAISKRAKHGQRAKNRTKTKLTNIMSRRVRKANKRLTKARGF
jgi:hypothetical protein